METLGGNPYKNIRKSGVKEDNMYCKVISNENDFIEAKERWMELYKNMSYSTPFQSWDWNYFWWKNHQGGELFILEAIEVKKSYGFMPLIIEGNEVKLIGDKHFDYGLIIMVEKKKTVFDLLLNHIFDLCKKRKLTFKFLNIPIACNQFALFKELASFNKKVAFREIVPTAYINIQEYRTIDSYLLAISSSLRKKAIKPCIKENIIFQIEEYSEELWIDIERIYCVRQQERIGVSTLAWAKDVVKDLSAQGLLKIATLKKLDERVAFTMLFNDKQKFYTWLTAFARMGELGLGHFMKYNVIEKAYQEGVSVVDMMRGAYDYKKEWDCNVTYNYEFILFRNRIKKRLYLIKQSLRKKLRNFVYGSRFLKRLYQKKSKN